MNVKSIAVVDFVVETSGKGICKMGAVIPFEPLFPTSHEVILQSLAQGLLSQGHHAISLLLAPTALGGWEGKSTTPSHDLLSLAISPALAN